MKKIIISILLIVLAGGGAYYILSGNKKRNQEQVAVVAQKNTEVMVRTAPVKYENVNNIFSVNGNFIPNTRANISAETGGQVVGLYVKEGSYVSVGEVIAKLKGDKFDVGVSNAKANYDQALSQLNRFEQAYKTGGITALQLDQARLQVKNAKSQMQSAQLNSGDTVVRSKVSGIVNRKNIELGTIIGAGTPIVEVVDISTLKLKVEVDEALVTQLSVGQGVRLKPAVLDKELEGRISFIAPVATGALKFPVEISVSNDFNTLKAGMYGTAYFQKGESRTLVVPREAFVGSVSENQIFVIRNSKAELIKVQSGLNYGDKIEILSGLKEGDEVITSGQINLQTGTLVKVLK